MADKVTTLTAAGQATDWLSVAPKGFDKSIGRDYFQAVIDATASYTGQIVVDVQSVSTNRVDVLDATAYTFPAAAAGAIVNLEVLPYQRMRIRALPGFTGSAKVMIASGALTA